jgi:Secretion system C-terminal sorting domain
VFSYLSKSKTNSYMKKNFIIFLCIVSFTFNISKSNAQTNTLTDVQSTIGSASSGWLFEPAQADANHFFDVINTTRTGLQRFGFNMSVEEAIYDYAANNGSLNFAKLDVWCKAGASRNILLSCLVDYYWTDGVWGRHTNPVASYNWYNIGRNLALRYAPNSSWWTSQGISNYGLTNYALFNEPDEYNSGNGITDGPKTISSTDYHNALQQFANGVHSVSSTLQVYSGGWAWKDQNINTYAPYIMDLISNGTLNGINQHMYVGNYPWEIDNFNNYSWTPQGMYQFFVNQYSLPATTKFITDEMNVNADVPNADSRFCSYVWNTLGITNANGQPAFGNVCEVYSVFEGEGEANLSLCWNGRTNVQDPWLGNVRGRCLQMISNLTTGMSFTSVDARRTFGGTTTGTGKYILDGGGKRLWVWHNKNNWTNATGTSFTCTGIPAGTVKIDVYRYNSCSQTVGTTGTLVPYATATISGQTSYTFTGLPADETLMFKSTTGTASWIAIDDNAPGWTYNNGFNYDGGCTSCFNMTNHETNTSNKSATVSFTGTAVELYCEAWSGAGSVKVYIDGVLKGTYSQNITPAGGAKLFATISGLSDASHTLKITSSSNSWVSIDYIRYYSITANLSRTSLVTGTKSNIDNAVLIYPNPVSRGGNIYIDLSAYKTVKDKVIQIVDLSGKVVYKRTVNSTIKNLAINASRFSKGFYNILVRDSNTTCTRKLIVQ